ncbi:hypothetical protein CELD12_26370 [Cellulomonas sp. NTE-D12]|nr:hypothetical protein CELD12_26370 [Cellulomonas sp. NTE-D12]
MTATVAAYHSTFGIDGKPIDPDDGGIQARFVPIDEIKANGFDLNIGRYLKADAVEATALGTLIEGYNVARAQRQSAEERMLAVLAEAGIGGFDE